MGKRLVNCFFISTILLVIWVFDVSYGEDSGGTHFYFVQITDTHFGDADHYERTKKVVDRINDLPFQIQFVALTGDITMNTLDDDAVLSKGLSILQRIKAPIHFVPGNHDILSEKLDKTKQAYLKHFGHLITKYNYGGVTFIFVYTEPLAESFKVNGFDPLSQLNAMLETAGNSPVVIFHHRPSVDDFYRNVMHPGWDWKVRRKWDDMINSYNVKAVIAGHFHRDELHWLGEVPLYVSAPVAGYFGRQATFRIYEYRNGRIGYRTQYIR